MWIFVFLVLTTPVILGNRYFSSKLIRKTLKEGRGEILDLYKEHGFLRANIKVFGDTILIEEGSQFNVGKIKLKGNQALSDSELLFQIETHKVFNESNLTQWIEKILDRYENSGYPFCKINLDSLEIKEKSVNFDLQIFEGPLVIIDNIELNGNKFTKDYVILRELKIESGDTFSEKAICGANQRIQGLKFIEFCNISPKSKNELLVQIKEGPANWINGAFGYGAPGFMGFFDLEVLNLFGTGRAIGAKWQKRDTFSVQFGLRYKEPWLFGPTFGGINLIGSVSHNREATYVKNRAEILLEVPISKMLRANIGWCGKWIVLHTSYLRDSQWLGVLGFDFDTRPSFHNMQCRRGLYYQARSEFNFAGVEKLTLNLDNYISIFFLSLNIGALFKKDIQVYDKMKFGGARTIRGYWEGEFTGTQIGWLNLELRKSIGTNSFIFPFCDFGYVDGTFLHSWGTGVAMYSPIGLVKVIYGLARKDSFRDGKIHFLIKSEF